MENRKSIAAWLYVGVPLFVVGALLAALALHVALGLSWAEILPPVVVFVGIQVASFAAMFWARRRVPSDRGMRAAITVAGLYCLGAGLVIIRYGTRWGLLGSEKNANSDCVGFVICIVLATIVALVACQRLVGDRTDT